jgi:hypothetical protein
MGLTFRKLIKSVYVEPISITGGKSVVADQIYHNKNTGFATLFLVLQERKNKRKIADMNVNKP